MNSFSKNSIITFITEILIFISGFVILIIISRVLGPEGKGMYSLIALIPGTIAVFSGIGIESANVYFSGKRKYKIGDIAYNSLVISVLVGAVMIFVFGFVLGPDFLKKLLSLSGVPSFYIMSAILIIPFMLFLNFWRNIVRGEERLTEYNISRLLDNLFQLVLILIFIFALRLRLAAAVFSFILSMVVSSFVVFYLVVKKNKLSSAFNFGFAKDSFIYGAKIYLANIVSFLSYRFDLFLVAFFLNPIQVGFYSISVAIAERMLIIPGTLSTVLFPRVSASEPEEANHFTAKICRHTAFLMVALSIAVFFLARPFIGIFFGSSFLPAVGPLLLILPGIVAFGIGGLLAADLSGRGRPEFAIYSASICLVSNIILNILFIPRFGISGAAIASSIAYWLDTFVIIFAFFRISKKSLSDFLLIKKSDFKDYQNIFYKFIGRIYGK